MTKKETDELIDLIDSQIAKTANLDRDFSESIDWNKLNIKTSIIRKAARKSLQHLKGKGFTTIDSLIPLCNSLLETGHWVHRTTAFQWSFNLRKQFQPSHFSFLQHWVNNHLHSWGSCDDLCTHSMGYFLMKFPQFVDTVKKWTESDNPYVRRAAAVSFIYALRRGKLFQHIFDISDRLFQDPHHHVLKGYGWMLKEATKHFMDGVFDYVLDHKEEMPRLSLRYAVEKMPEHMRRKAMS